MKLHDDLKKIINYIIRTVPTEKIALIGYVDEEGKIRSVFYKDPLPAGAIKEVNILVITKNVCEKEVITDQIEQKFRYTTPVTCNIIPVKEIASLGQLGCKLVIDIFEAQAFIYERFNPQPINYQPTNTDYIAKYNQDVSYWHQNATHFWNLACSQHKASYNRINAFCLHQACELFLGTITQCIMGYRLGTHNLWKIIRFIRFFRPDVSNVFAPQSAKDSNTFRLLKMCYIHARYKTEFAISDEDLEYLMQKVEKIKSFADELFQEHSKKIIGCEYAQTC